MALTRGADDDDGYAEVGGHLDDGDQLGRRCASKVGIAGDQVEMGGVLEEGVEADDLQAVGAGDLTDLDAHGWIGIRDWRSQGAWDDLDRIKPGLGGKLEERLYWAVVQRLVAEGQAHAQGLRISAKAGKSWAWRWYSWSK